MTMHNTPPPPPADNAIVRTAQFVGAVVASLLVVVGLLLVGSAAIGAELIVVWMCGVLVTPAALVWVTRLSIAAVRSSVPPTLTERPIARIAQFVGAAAASLLVLGLLYVTAWHLKIGLLYNDSSAELIAAWALGVLAVLLIPAALVWVSRLFIAAVRASLPSATLAERPVARIAQFVGAAAEYAPILAVITILVIVALRFLQPAISQPCIYGCMMGTVTSVHGSSYTVTDGYTVNATSSTTYFNRDDTVTSASAVKVGTCISFWIPWTPPTVNEDPYRGPVGTTLTVDRIRIYSYGAGACP
jgi:hypothetical protein